MGGGGGLGSNGILACGAELRVDEFGSYAWAGSWGAASDGIYRGRKIGQSELSVRTLLDEGASRPET